MRTTTINGPNIRETDNGFADNHLDVSIVRHGRLGAASSGKATAA